MKRITVFLFACLLVALPFSSVYAQKIEGTIQVFADGLEDFPMDEEVKFSKTAFTVKKLNSDRIIEIIPTELAYMSLYLTETKVGKYKLSSSYSIEDQELPTGYTALRYYYYDTYNVMDNISGGQDQEYITTVKNDCKKYSIPMQSELEITKSENGKISGIFTATLFNADCSYFNIDCVMTIKGTFTDLKIE
jgi:hypothetical protein